MREFGREERVGDFIRDELASIIQRQMRDPRVGMVSVNEVKVSKDLSYAEVYVSSHETRTDAERAELIGVLNKAAGYFRSELAKRHSMRTTPRPRFHYDEVIERGPALESLMRSPRHCLASSHQRPGLLALESLMRSLRHCLAGVQVL